MKQQECIVNLDLPPELRWQFLSEHRGEVNELLQCYLNDFKKSQDIFLGINAIKSSVISDDYLKEIDYIASISKFSPDEVLVANLYYDILKFYLGCTAFAFEKDGKIIHSRNLDWWTDNNLLSKHSRVFDFQRKGKTIFKTIGWFGFIGALSGIKAQKFSLTLNAVSSIDDPLIATPVTFFLRDILDSADSYAEAKYRLESETIASDCLLLLSGSKENEMAVIERTPKRFATRGPEDDFIIVTNDYKKLENNAVDGNLLHSTSCGRYDRTKELLTKSKPNNFDECIVILQDENIKMGITVQQMVFDNSSGEIKLIKT